MDIDDEMMMEMLMQDEAAADQEQRMMVLTALVRYREQLATVPAGVVLMLGRRRTRIGIDSQVRFCLTPIILRMMQQIPLRNSCIVFG
jgi:hypothetical protein